MFAFPEWNKTINLVVDILLPSETKYSMGEISRLLNNFFSACRNQSRALQLLGEFSILYNSKGICTDGDVGIVKEAREYMIDNGTCRAIERRYNVEIILILGLAASIFLEVLSLGLMIL